MRADKTLCLHLYGNSDSAMLVLSGQATTF